MCPILIFNPKEIRERANKRGERPVMNVIEGCGFRRIGKLYCRNPAASINPLTARRA